MQTLGVGHDMREYYARRAAIYERVYFKPERQDDLRAIEAGLAGPFAGRHVLEIACGTGWWTPHGARDAASWLATDVNAETLAVARTKHLPSCVRLAQLDAYTLDGLEAEAGDAPFDAAFAGCWWSHVPLHRLPGWLDTLHARLPSGARVVFLDNSFVQTSSTPISRRDGAGNTYQLRTLDDGSTHEVVKNFPHAQQAAALLGPRARQVQWSAHTHYWVMSYVLS
jgi:demethylmenaquinone methyltransferase/2-methoxy-6-polyprenyl-1,4-benzoquinol methylase